MFIIFLEKKKKERYIADYSYNLDSNFGISGTGPAWVNSKNFYSCIININFVIILSVAIEVISHISKQKCHTLKMSKFFNYSKEKLLTFIHLRNLINKMLM